MVKGMSDSFQFIVALALLFFPIVTVALDNPDAPNYMQQLETGEAWYLEKINNASPGSRSLLIAYDEYYTFLDHQLNIRYQELMSALPKSIQGQLKQSQLLWIKQKDKEFEFIQNAWTKTNHGSSSGGTKAAFRVRFVRDRLVKLIWYLKAV